MSALQEPNRLGPDVEHALAALATDVASLDRAALERLAPLMDAILDDLRPAPARCASLLQGVDAALGHTVAHALGLEARAPADIAARFFRLRELAALAEALTPARR